MPELKRKRFLELFHGRLVVQSAYASKGNAHRAPFADDMIPHSTIFDNVRWTLEVNNQIELRDNRFGGVRMRIGASAAAYLRRVNNRKTTGEILDEMTAVSLASVDRGSLKRLVEAELEPVFYYDIISLCDRPFRDL